MKIFHLNLFMRDFIPPVFLLFWNCIRSHFGKSPQDCEALHSFISPVMRSYSQFNEDLILDILLNLKKNGTYLDIGANDPTLDSNTKRFYDRGWSGINIEPGKDAFERIRLERPRDLNLNIGVGSINGFMIFYQVVENSQVSSFNKKIAMDAASSSGWTIKEIQIEVWTISKLFETYLKDKKIDFMSVDAEGQDLEVLQSNDWNKFRPTLVLVEIDKNHHEIVDYMLQREYMLVFNNEHNGIFIDKKDLKILKISENNKEDFHKID